MLDIILLKKENLSNAEVLIFITLIIMRWVLQIQKICHLLSF